jgi:transcriptional regulator with XRE-family HTH domain
MGEPPRAPEGLIASRLDQLFRSVRPKDRDSPYTAAEVAAAINAAAGEHVIGATYVWQLRTGRRDNPTYKHLIALARFFGVSPVYFFDEAETGRGAIPVEVALALKEDDVRELALRAAGLSEHSLKAIKAMIESARTMEHLPLQDATRISSGQD